MEPLSCCVCTKVIRVPKHRTRLIGGALVAEDELQSLYSVNSSACYDCSTLVQKIFHLRDELKKAEERFSAITDVQVQPRESVASPTALLSAGSPPHAFTQCWKPETHWICYIHTNKKGKACGYRRHIIESMYAFQLLVLLRVLPIVH